MTMEDPSSRVAPFLKWAGGKRWLSPSLAHLLSNPRGSYIEPFLGGASVFFAVRCEHALLSDINEELMNAYRVVRDQVEDLIRVLAQLPVDRKLFDQIKSESCFNPIARAARFVYLNKTAFNGLFRVNKFGEFNVPFGCKDGTRVCEAATLRACSASLQKAGLYAADFKDVLEFASGQDSIFVDPPYTVKHDNNGFRRYNERIFSWQDQVQLAAICSRLAKAGARVIITNASHHEVIALYPKRLFSGCLLSRATTMAANVGARGRCQELLLLSRSISEVMGDYALPEQRGRTSQRAVRR